METDRFDNPARIMIVDDERPAANMLASIFRQAGYACIVCYSGETAVAVAPSYGPHLLLCDLTLGTFSGEATMASIAKQLPQCRILIHTGDYLALAHAQHTAHTQGLVQAFLTKPQPPLVLLREVRKLLHSPATPAQVI
jgi:DNA-binding response OmpR family regulator